MDATDEGPFDPLPDDRPQTIIQQNHRPTDLSDPPTSLKTDPPIDKVVTHRQTIPQTSNRPINQPTIIQQSHRPVDRLSDLPTKW
jgi:hypothetical protein